ncbi:formyltetrahydrofolate deformylase [Mesorhizobium microcysteis]|uniref:Formyltetrahydrofolate deformylase n=1 Tax=Neoaquamicrobium microcysteis TaxID=2682781 RepID=A0A5D4GN52_9HYPH|nr:formyltetrahydrofolate deformylase [Mesorhizobium microcysteis]TYR29564.1 formyltetrahydrofolate deformylase [Mesorhizobium microcysteis]
MTTDASLVLTAYCTNRAGIVAALSKAVFDLGGDILDLQQFDDAGTGQFFSRVVFRGVSGPLDADTARRALAPVMDGFAMTWSLRVQGERRRVLLMASKFDHCLADLLYRWQIGELPMDVRAIVSNHPRETYANLSFADIPFHYLPVSKENKAEQEDKLAALIEAEQIDLVVLARYMQVLSHELSARLAGRCINIHHSFLPGFKGAKPYHQAYERGVKLIGATAHYVTSDLDEGPIIEQDIERISHRDSADELVRKGRDIERRVLARAVRSHLEDRVLINGMRTIVFPE